MATMLALVAVGAGAATKSSLMAGLSLVSLAVAAWRLWVPVTFDLGSKGVIQRIAGRARQIPWAQFARYQALPLGLLLSTDADPTLTAAVYSLFIPWTGRRDEILKVVEYYSQTRVTTASTKDYIQKDGAGEVAATPEPGGS